MKWVSIRDKQAVSLRGDISKMLRKPINAVRYLWTLAIGKARTLGGPQDSGDEMVRYWDEGFRRAEKEPGSFYDLNKLPPITQASHHRRMELLDTLPIGDVSDKVCVDYGVGSWGFACIYPRLQHCRKAIGIDISKEAIRISAEISRTGNFPYGKNYQYLMSRGEEIGLDDASVDVFFAGEAIEHVENVDAFLDEVHRILKPEGLFILTTPNADAYLYKMHGERYCFNAEHVSLMSFAELQSFLASRFETLVAKGFNGSFYRLLDDKLTDPQFAKDWAAYFEDRPDMATGVVIMARKRADYQPHRYSHLYYPHSSPAIQYEGKWENCNLFGPFTGNMGQPDWQSKLSMEFGGNGLLINFWGHPWSGFAGLELDGVKQTVNLYSPETGIHKVRLSDLGPGGHKLVISASNEKDPRSQGYQVILWRMVSYTVESADL
jgi:SAM-dependent methyltransferase